MGLNEFTLFFFMSVAFACGLVFGSLGTLFTIWLWS